MRNIRLLCVPVLFFLIVLSGCLNMPTPPSQIVALQTSTVLYEKLSDEELQVELDAALLLEGQLLVAQTQRRKTSKVQAFWYGFGQGDGMEAAQLSQIRGQVAAMQKVLARRNSIHK